MTPSAHLLISWLSTVEILKNRRERTLLTLTGVAPDLDGFGYFIDTLTGTTDLYFKFHHYFGHSLLTVFVLSSIASLFAKTQRFTVWIMALLVINIHIACDIVGSKGPDGYQWPIYYYIRLTGFLN